MRKMKPVSEALKLSIKETSFWDNILARPHPKKKGRFQIAYGAHRLTVLKELKILEIDIPVRDLDDATMIRIMGDENLQDWTTNAGVVVETVTAAKEFLDAELEKCKTWGEFKKSELHKTMRFNNAQTFMAAKGKKGVGETTLLKFLGGNWKQWRIQEALAILKDVGEGTLDPKAAQAFPKLDQAKQFRQLVRENKVPRRGQVQIAKQLSERWNRPKYSSVTKPSQRNKTKGRELPKDQTEALRTLSESLSTARQLITLIEGKEGRQFWSTEPNKKLTKRIRDHARELIPLLMERF